MYIRTAHAWYILDVPSAQYEGYELSFSTKARFFNDLFHAAADEGNKDAELDLFIREHELTRDEDDWNALVRANLLFLSVND